MKVNKFFAIIAFIFVSASVYAYPRRGQDLVPSGHWVYDALFDIELDIGRWALIDQTPVTIQTVRSILDEVPFEKLSESARVQYQRIQDYINEFDISLDGGVFSIGIEPAVNVEIYAKTNKNLEWLYNYHDRQRLLYAPVNVRLSDFMTVSMGIGVGQRRSYMNNHDNYVNHIFVEEAFDPNLTHSTYLSTGYRWDNGVGVNLNFGYGKANFGRAGMGSIIQSDYLTDLPYVQLRTYAPFFAYSFNISQLNPQETMYTHTIDFRLWKKFTVGFMEGGAAYNVFDMRFINPFGIFHSYELNNQYDWISYMGVKFNFVPCKNLRLYFMIAQDEHQMFTEQTSGPGALPEGKGYQGGIDFQIPVKGGRLKFNVEGYYATPYLWIKQSPNWSLVSAKDGDYEWIGSPVGPDSIAGKISAGFEKPGKWSLFLNYIFAARGEFSSDSIFGTWGWNNTEEKYAKRWIYVDSPGYEYGRELKSPHGIAEYDNIFYLRGEWKPLDWLTLVAQPSYIFAFNYGHKDGNFQQGFEMALSVRIEFCRMMKKPLDMQWFLKDWKED